jgi:KDO2-lipid IV(A) lauroyltransferase
MNGPKAAPETGPAATRPAAPREPWWQRAGVGVLAAGFWFVGALPAWLAYAIADVLAVPWAIYWSLADRRGRRSKGYWRNVRIAFRPGAPLGERRPRWHLWRWSRWIARLAIEFCRLHRLRAHDLERHCDLTEYPPIRDLYAEGKGIIFATGHIGTWEIAGHAAAILGLPITSVFRPSPVPALDRWIARTRSVGGQTVVAKQNVLWTLKKALADRQVIGLLCDGGAKHSAVFAPFLGTLASTVATPALLHLATGAPIAVVTVTRTRRERWRLHVWDVIRHDPGADRDADLRAITARINAGLEKGIAAAPEQWFWQSRRFRHRPPGEAAGPDGLPPLAAASKSS